MSKIGVRIVAIGILLTSCASAISGTKYQSREIETEAECAVAQLGSADLAVQEAAKQKLLVIGSAAAPSLIKALRDAVNQQNRPYFPNEYEKFKSLRRMRAPLYEVVGKLKLAEAIPFLIQAMETRPQDSGTERCEPDLEALVKIGQPSVLPLIRSLENAEATYDRNEKVIIIQVLVTAIKVRAARALGNIGDIAALPALEKADNELKDVSIWEAIQLLKKRNGLRYERWPNGWEPEPFLSRFATSDVDKLLTR